MNTFSQLFHERVTANQRESVKAYAFVLTDYLQRHPGEQRAAALAELQKHGDEGFSLLTMQDVILCSRFVISCATSATASWC
jgi:two-component system OmpR family sensor kinase